MGDAPLELRKPGGMLVYGLPAASTLFMLRMLWATKRDAVPSDHSYWAMHTPIVLMPLAAAVLAGGIALAWRYERPEWVMGGVLVPALLLDLAGVGEWAPIMPMIAYWALIMTVAGDLRVLCFGLVSCMVLDSQAFAGNVWRQAGWSIWLDVLPGTFSSCLTGLSYRVSPSRSRACAWCALLPTSRPAHTSMSSGVIIVPPVMKVFPAAVDSEESGRPAPHPHYDETCAMRP